MVSTSKPNYSNYSSLGTQASMGCTDPKRETQLYELTTLDKMWETNYLPRLAKNFQVAKRYSSFPLENEMTNKSSNLHTGVGDVYYEINTPKRCLYKSCGETNIPVYVANKLKR